MNVKQQHKLCDGCSKPMRWWQRMDKLHGEVTLYFHYNCCIAWYTALLYQNTQKLNHENLQKGIIKEYESSKQSSKTTNPSSNNTATFRIKPTISAF